MIIVKNIRQRSRRGGKSFWKCACGLWVERRRWVGRHGASPPAQLIPTQHYRLGALKMLLKWRLLAEREDDMLCYCRHILLQHFILLGDCWQRYMSSCCCCHFILVFLSIISSKATSKSLRSQEAEGKKGLYLFHSWLKPFFKPLLQYTLWLLEISEPICRSWSLYWSASSTFWDRSVTYHSFKT